MSAINLITAFRPSTSATGAKSAAPQTIAAAQPQPAENTSRVTISSDAAHRANYEAGMADRLAGEKSMRAMVLRDADVSSPATAKLAHDMAYADHTDGQGGGGVVDVSDPFHTRYSDGNPVTDESKAYFTREEGRYRQERSQLYESEVAKKTPPGEIVNKLFDLQDQQPARFRSMNVWPVDADFSNNK